ncbi:MAG: gamma-glutamyl-gamma-aminobutyrate hydrolase family protein [Clostridiales bacterium]|nr:gamma-glutamyl-gamma-aminobutyrate hydrolase family protein [Clostridiales bacterium]
MKKAIIGITPSMDGVYIKMNKSYVDAVIFAGGVPVFLPYPATAEQIDGYVNMCDGLILGGGCDVSPARYGEEIKFDSVEINSERDAFEFEIFDKFKATGKPILGICRGVQLMNVALGGTLFQHIEGHRQTEGRDDFSRTANVCHGTKLEAITGAATLRTNSFHHQAIKDVAPCAELCALADDGTIESIAVNDYGFMLGVQWHPELFCKKDEAAAKIFDSFIKSAQIH